MDLEDGQALLPPSTSRLKLNAAETALLSDTAIQSSRRAFFVFTALLGITVCFQTLYERDVIFPDHTDDGPKKDRGTFNGRDENENLVSDALQDVWDGLEDLRKMYDAHHVTVNISATDESIRFMGRHAVDERNGHVLFDNTGFVMGFRMRGSAGVGMRYSEPAAPLMDSANLAPNGEPGDVFMDSANLDSRMVTSRFRVWIDDKERSPVLINPHRDANFYSLTELFALDVDDGEWHTIVLQKVSDASHSMIAPYGGTLMGFTLDKGAEIKPLADTVGKHSAQVLRDVHNDKKRRLEFIGDGWLAGDSVSTKAVHIRPGQLKAHATQRSRCPGPAQVTQQDSSAAYTVRAARMLNSGYHLSGVQSGAGVQRQYGGYSLGNVRSAQEMFQSSHVARSAPWDGWSRWIPQAVVVAVGKNDFTDNMCENDAALVRSNACTRSGQMPVSEEVVVQGYVDLANTIRSRYTDPGHTKIVLVCETNPEHVVLFDRDRSCAAAVTAVAQLGGEEKGMYLVDLSPTFAKGGGSAGWTCAATPTAPTHELAANHLAWFLGDILGWDDDNDADFTGIGSTQVNRDTGLDSTTTG